MKQIVLGVDGMSLEDLETIARHDAKVRLAKESEQRIVKSRALVDRWLSEGRVIYGVTTGFGALSDVKIGAEAGEMV
jgi:histidine ammonia-lyase